MKEEIEEVLEKLMFECGFGEINAPIISVSGGFLHHMYQVTTVRGIYAVKHLNAKIMSKPDVFANYARAEKIESILENSNIPIVPAITIHGSKMQHVDGHYFYIFHWQEGHITDWNSITYSECNIAGNLLGRIHAVAPKNVSHKEPGLSKIDWHKYILNAREANHEIAAILAENEELLLYAEAELNKARLLLPDLSCLSDEDMDPKNIMWDKGKPVIIDLECLDYGNPISHSLQLALQWSGISNCNIDIEKMIAFFNGYLAAYDNCYRTYSDVFGLAYTWVEWLEFNIQRALESSIDKSEKTIGISEVINTIERVKYIQKEEKNIKSALDTRLGKLEINS